MNRGDRIKMTPLAIKKGFHHTNWKVDCKSITTGVLVGFTQDGALKVKRDGIKTIGRYHPDFWELA